MIALLVPTRGRADKLRRMIESALATAKEFVIYVYVADDDPDMDQYNELSKEFGHDENVFWCHGLDYPTVYKWNYLAKQATEAQLLMLASDDIIFATPEWDRALMEHYNGLANKIHCWALQDSRDRDGVPHPLVSREWIKAMGWFLPPYFLHWQIDVWTNEIAKANNCFTHMRDYLLVHDKANDKGQPDATHTGIRARGWPQRDKEVANDCRYMLDYEKKRLAEKLNA